MNPIIALALNVNLTYAQAMAQSAISRAAETPLAVTQATITRAAIPFTVTQAAPRDSWFGADKIKHFFLSAFATSLSYGALQGAGASRQTAMGGAVAASLALGIARETYNRRTTKLFSLKDLTWDAIGTAAAATMLNHTRR